MLPATVALWLGLEITGFALLYDAGMGTHAFRLNGADASLGTAFYISGGGISSLTFGDVVARAPLDRALVDLETILGLATFTLALGYVVTAFGALGSLEQLHGRVRRHADEPDRPSSIIARHFAARSRATSRCSSRRWATTSRATTRASAATWSSTTSTRGASAGRSPSSPRSAS